MKLDRKSTGARIAGARPDVRPDFVRTAPGSALLARLLETPRPAAEQRSKRRAVTVGAAVVLGTLLAGGATAAIGGYGAPTAPSEALPANADAFLCATAGLRGMGEVPPRAGETPVDACRRGWEKVFGGDAPTHLYGCVKRATAGPTPGTEPSTTLAWGAVVYVVDGDQFKDAAQTCGSVGMFVAPARR
ncbi:hypothetical protein GKC29_20550 [Micromonospora sp. WMMC415]|uniref:hypothetical protein n=1 Tax=Micromonospora sp. WMMC415 TaxID=2675222 RepID=UPI0012B4D1AA|nr:hypothetical protein [Micromonospora sp. WMMC415]QGN48980.1 hypothetical protein GKC29_20550 [Micromonospora sp. WMMC415]